MTRVLVADDQALVRAGLVALVTAAPGLEVVAEAADGEQAVLAARTARPDVVLMDIRMPRMDGIEATRRISALDEPRPRVIVLTTFDLDEYVYAALREGASGFLLKDTPPAQIIGGLRSVTEGNVLMAPSVTRRLVERFAPAAGRPDARLEGLTPRETEVLTLVARGWGNDEIARSLVLSEETVKTHVKRIMAKLQLSSRAQAVVAGYESGLVRVSPSAGPRT